jgi:hypothetical protein
MSRRPLPFGVNPTVEQRGKTTENAAVRLMKSRARHHVYSERAAASGNPALRNMTWLEGEILREVEKDWRTIISCWQGMTAYERQVLVAILRLAKNRAIREAAEFFDDQTTKESLLRFFESFQAADLIPTEGAS